jgi:hypothetical protein
MLLQIKSAPLRFGNISTTARRCPPSNQPIPKCQKADIDETVPVHYPDYPKKLFRDTKAAE